MARAPGNGLDVDNMPLKDLVELLASIAVAIPERKRTEVVELRAKLVGIAAEAGYTLEEVVGGRGKRKGVATGSVAVKYRNPDDASETWSGRGRMTKWLSEKLKKRGAKLEDFSV